MSERPDYVKHINRDIGGAWCGGPVGPLEWMFVSIDHAARAQFSRDRLLPCRCCVEAVVAALKTQEADWP